MLPVPALIELVTAADPGSGKRFRESRRQTLALLQRGSVALERTHYSPGHITCSAVVLSQDRSHVLLIFHPRLQRWLQPGGHVEMDDLTPAGAAAREVAEETGVLAGDPDRSPLVSIDVHHIPPGAGEPAHLHHDLVWRFIVPRLPLGPAEGPVAWWPVDRLADCNPDASLSDAVARSIAKQ